MKYRVETVNIPAHGGIADPGSASLDLPGRRIVHVIDAHPGNPGTPNVRARVLTEEMPAPTIEHHFSGSVAAEDIAALG